MYKMIKQGGAYNDQIPYFVCDTLDEIDLIPISKETKDSIGDRVYVISEGESYIRNSEGKWEVDKSSEGSSGGGGGTVIKEGITIGLF